MRLWQLWVFILFCLGTCEAWWDEGHMLIAAVAELVLTYSTIPHSPRDADWLGAQTPWPWTPSEGQKSLDKINSILRGWDDQYPEYADLISAAVWADHIKCVQPSQFCQHGLDGIEIFNPVHFVDVRAYAPHYDRTDQEHQVRRMTFETNNAIWILNQISRSLSRVLTVHDVMPMSTPDLFQVDVRKALGQLVNHTGVIGSAPGSVGTPPSLLNRHELGFKDIDHIDQLISRHGTLFSYNLLLRLFIHILGDIHQPLHTLTRVDATCSPNGDHGGNTVPIIVDSVTESKSTMPETYHQFWDSAGGTYTRNFPDFTPALARIKARDLIARYVPRVDPATQQYVGFSPNITEILLESQDVALTFAYPPLDLLGYCPTYRHPFRPSSGLIAEIRNHAEERIVSAGYNLACFLRLFAREIPQNLIDLVPQEDVTFLKSSVVFWRSACLTSLGFGSAVLTLFVYYLFLLRKEAGVALMSRALLDETNKPLIVGSDDSSVTLKLFRRSRN